ncbi:hypothetical protein [Agrobacterium fabrum]|uniref:hypothetical protein n=1 Tax=Agrobacterium fabrum TaxID=1176649 RepID=UPI003B9FB6F7
MEAAVNAAEAYSHIRAVMGMVVGLSLARLLTGLAGFVQHPKKERIYPLHIGWVAFLFLMLVHFWWWEHRLSATGHVLDFGAFLFLILFCSLFYFLCVLLFPTDMKEYKGYEDYFFSRKSWFFGFLAALFVTDVGDTLLKGHDYLASLGPEYLIRTAIYVVLFTAAAFIDNRRFHRFLVIFALVYQIAWIFRTYDLLA